MEQKTQEALDFVRMAWKTQPFDEDDYLAACEHLVDHRADLPARVFIALPGGLSGNDDLRWDRVKAGSEERCSCGNERVILPLNPRTEYQSSEQQVVVSHDNEVYLKPLGGDKASTYFKLWITEESLAYMVEPFAPFVLTPDLFSTKGYNLKQIADAMKKQSQEPVMYQPQGEHQIPIFAINAVDEKKNTVTITPDMAVEVFDPEAYEDGHVCSETQ